MLPRKKMLSRSIVHSRQKSYFSSHLSFCTLWYNTNFCSKIRITLLTFKALKFSIWFISSFRRRKLTLKPAWISRFSYNILSSIDQVFLINFQFQVSKIKFRYRKPQLNYLRITRAQLFWTKNSNFSTVCRCFLNGLILYFFWSLVSNKLPPTVVHNAIMWKYSTLKVTNHISLYRHELQCVRA